MYALRIKHGEHKGKYVGKKRSRSWDWKPSETLDQARIFSTIGGVKSFFGRVYGGAGFKEFLAEHREYLSSMPRKDIPEAILKNYHKERETFRIQYTDRYELVELKVKEV